MKTRRFDSAGPPAAGFTIVEAAVSVVLVGTLLVASTGTFSAIARNRAVQTESRTALLLGQQLMAEILQCYFRQQATPPVFGPVAGQTRADFNYVDAYDGYAAAPPTTKAGLALAGYDRWAESVAVAYVDPANPAGVSAGSTLKRVTVTVTAPSGKQYVLVGLRSQFGVYETPPTVQTNLVTGVAVTVQGASPAKTIYSGAHPLNITTSQ